MRRHRVTYKPTEVKAAKVFCQDREKHLEVIEKIEKMLHLARYMVCNPEGNINSELIDLVVSYGGDGTMMRAANLHRNAIIVGINAGHLGFLTAYNSNEWEQFFVDLSESNLFYEERLRLDVALHTQSGMVTQSVFNDVYIKHGENPRLLNLNVKINEQNASTVGGDGIIVSTPSGSTGYNLAARGPIISSGTDVFAITPICPHSLTSLPMITSELTRVTFVGPSNAEAYVNYDGVKHKVRLRPGDYIEVKKSSDFSKIIPPANSVFEALQKKMNWSTV